MKKNWLYLLLIIVTPLLIFSCKKDTSATTLVGNWSEPGQIKGYRVGAISFTIGDSAYYGLGYNQNNKPNQRYLKDFYKYDCVTNQYTKLADFPGDGRSDAVAFSINGRGYVGTGYNADDTAGIYYLKDFWEYNPAANKWTKMAHLPAEKMDPNNIGRRNAVAFAIDNYGYVGTGLNNNNYLNDFWKFTANADTGVWVNVADLPFARANAAAFVLTDPTDNVTKGYIVTGDNNGSYGHSGGADRLYAYNPATNIWEKKRDIAPTSTTDSYDDNYNIVRSNAVALVWSDGNKTKAYVTTGTNNTVLNDTWEYDPGTDLWIQKTSFEGGPRSSAFGFSIKDKANKIRIFVAAGKSGSSLYSDIWEFNPNAEYDAYN